MVSRNVLLILFILGVFSSQLILQTKAFEDQLISLVASKLFGLWQSENIEFLGHSCQYRIRPKIRKLKLKYDGKFWCPGLAPFSGTALKSSRSGTVEHAIKDFATQAVAKKVVNMEEVELWLKGQKR